ncbi:ferredoxin [Paenibacillus cremeus]|uniref:Ferredoxin n=1 Tax=Paenibacillus cremeus TaxID=2163881 RepID=A0A559KE69_9BACL|nr:ferredoxin [Paenibacillus cremeus]
MARRLNTNVAGDLYVNDACINCDTCRQLAPDTFAEIGGYSAVSCQPVAIIWRGIGRSKGWKASKITAGTHGRSK